MSLPVYQTITLTPANLDDLVSYLRPDMNGRHAVVFNLLELNFDQQRETIGLIENFFHTNAASFKFPYPVYIITVHEPSITHLPVVSDVKYLPKFFNQKDGRMTIKEGNIASRNRLLQTEIRNVDPARHQEELKQYAQIHRSIWENEEERLFMKDVLSRLIKGAQNE
jgi:hypothetical protein